MQKTRSHQTMSLTPKLAGQMSMADFLAGVDSQRLSVLRKWRLRNVGMYRVWSAENPVRLGLTWSRFELAEDWKLTW